MGCAVIIFIINDFIELLIFTNEKSNSRISTKLCLIYTSFIYSCQINTYTLMGSWKTSKRNLLFGYFTFLEFYFVFFSTLTLLKALNLCITVLLLHWNSVTKYYMSICLREVELLPVGSFWGWICWVPMSTAVNQCTALSRVILEFGVLIRSNE